MIANLRISSTSDLDLNRHNERSPVIRRESSQRLESETTVSIYDGLRGNP